MREIERASAFKRDYKRMRASPRYRAVLDALLSAVFSQLTSDQPLDSRHHDHELSGEWKEYRECHLKPDLVLIYQKPDADTLRLVRLGSHSELFE
jgi:mRNA interferase YafQ